MSRDIISSSRFRTMDNQSSNEDDKYISKIIKLVPAEIISVYLVVFNLIDSSSQQPAGTKNLQWIVFLLIVAITPFYLKKVAKISSTRQVLFCTFSFVVWVLSMGGPLKDQLIGGFTMQFLGAIFLPIYTLIIPLVYDQTQPQPSSL